MEEIALMGVDTLTQTTGFLLFSDGGLFISQLLPKGLSASQLGSRSLSLASGVLCRGCLQQLRGTTEREGASQA
jgi:hypothetical protein